MSKTIKSRLFFGQRNYDFETHSFDEETKTKRKISDISQEEWKEKIKRELFEEIDDYSFLAVIFHDRDIKDQETNELKALHCHFVVRFNNPRSYTNILELTKCEERNFERSTNEGAILRYLTHTTPEAMRAEKTRYNVSELLVKEKGENDFKRGEILERWYRKKIKSNIGKKETDTKVVDFVNDLAYRLSIGEFKPINAREMLIAEFGNEFGQSIYRKEKKKFQEDYADFLETKKKDLLLNGKELSTIYIDGLSEVGKSTFAQDLANSINEANGKEILDTYLAAKKKAGAQSWDWISKYKDEYITIFNDVDPYDFNFTYFLGTFETKILVDVGSRYKDKTWFSEYAIITKSTDIHEFVNKICGNELREDNKQEHFNIRYQVQRRFSLIIKIEKNKVTLSKFNKKGLLKTKATFNFNDLQKEFWNGSIRKEIIQECLSLLDL